MAVWTNYATLIASLASGKAFTDEKAQALAENTLAGLECDLTAPVNSACWHPYDMVIANDGNDGLFYDFAASGAVASVETPTFVDGWEYRLRMVGISHNSGSAQDWRLELYRETTAAYATVGVLAAAVAGSSAYNALIELPTVRFSTFSHAGWASISLNPGGTNNLTFTAPNFFAQSLTVAQKISKARISFAAGSIDAGQMFLDKRRVYL